MTPRRRAEARRARRRPQEPVINWREFRRGALLGIAVAVFVVAFVLAFTGCTTRLLS
jgi:hypothetical protein